LPAGGPFDKLRMSVGRLSTGCLAHTSLWWGHLGGWRLVHGCCLVAPAPNFRGRD